MFSSLFMKLAFRYMLLPRAWTTRTLFPMQSAWKSLLMPDALPTQGGPIFAPAAAQDAGFVQDEARRI
jgi:hypothetical protein